MFLVNRSGVKPACETKRAQKNTINLMKRRFLSKILQIKPPPEETNECQMTHQNFKKKAKQFFSVFSPDSKLPHSTCIRKRANRLKECAPMEGNEQQIFKLLMLWHVNALAHLFVCVRVRNRARALDHLSYAFVYFKCSFEIQLISLIMKNLLLNEQIVIALFFQPFVSYIQTHTFFFCFGLCSFFLFALWRFYAVD